MAQMEVSFYSKVLGMQSKMNVIVPQKNQGLLTLSQKAATPPYPVLYLLHGRSGNHNDFNRFSSLERYAIQYGLVIVMADAQLSFYTDQKYGFSYFTFFTQELPSIISEFFHVSKKREDTYVAGYSMGGYGALKMALTYPEQYCAAANMSGSPDIIYSMSQNPFDKELTAKLCQTTFGSVEELKNSKDDLYFLARNLLKSNKPIPRFYLCVGQKDPFLLQNRAFFETFGQKLNISYHEEPGGHTWGFWDENIKKIITWFDIKKK